MSSVCSVGAGRDAREANCLAWRLTSYKWHQVAPGGTIAHWLVVFYFSMLGADLPWAVNPESPLQLGSSGSSGQWRGSQPGSSCPGLGVGGTKSRSWNAVGKFRA